MASSQLGLKWLHLTFGGRNNVERYSRKLKLKIRKGLKAFIITLTLKAHRL
jgi:hypothetical protein